MKDKLFFVIALMPAAIALAVSACGGEGGPRPPSASAAAAADGDFINSGPISAFGSVFINGIEYDTHHAEILMDGAPRLEDDLRVGMIVKVTGTVNADGVTGIARKIEFTDNVQGALGRVDAAARTLVVLGQTVVTDAGTVFDGAPLSRLAPGNIVEVSGLVDSAGIIHATHIDLKAPLAAPGDVQEVKGVVANLDDKDRTFTVQGLRVRYAGADLSALGKDLTNGMTVEVQGAEGKDTGGALLATRVARFATGLRARETRGVVLALDGLVTAFKSSTDFAVAGQPVAATAATRYRNGTAADLGVDAHVRVEGTVDGNGRLHASRIRIEPGRAFAGPARPPSAQAAPPARRAAANSPALGSVVSRAATSLPRRRNAGTVSVTTT